MADEKINNSITIKITEDNQDHNSPVSFDSVIKTLNKVHSSYTKFIASELLKLRKKNGKLSEKIKDNEIIKEMELYFTNLEYGSFIATLSPKTQDQNNSLFTQIPTTNQELLNKYKEKVIQPLITGNYQNAIKSFSEKERYEIFNPLFELKNNKNKFNIMFGNLLNNNDLNEYKAPDTITRKLYFSNDTKEKQNEKSIVQFVVIANKDKNNKFKISQKDINKALYTKELYHETYPYTTNNIVYNNNNILLSQTIEALVEFDDESNQFIITNDELDITVWGDTRESAIEAFNFMFVSLKKEYCDDKLENMSGLAIELRNKLNELILGGQ